MKRAIIILALLVPVLCAYASIRVVENTGSYLMVEFLLDGYEVQESDGFQLVHIEGANYPVQSGAPSLPSLEFKVGIPPYGSADYQVISSSTKQITLEQRIRPVPFPDSENDMSLYRYEISEELYRSQQQALLSSLDTHLYRSHSFVPFIINPVQYDGQYSLTLTTSALIRINIKGDFAAKSMPATDPMAEIFLKQVLNPDDAKFWQATDRATINYADFSRSPWWLRIETDKRGMFRINPSQLSGFPISEIDPRSFRLFTSTGKPMAFIANSPGNEFKEVPIRVVGEADGSFDSSDYIVFYGSDRSGWEHNNSIQVENNSLYHNPYSHNYVYWLTFAGDFASEPLRMPTDVAIPNFSTEYSSHPEFVHLETESQRREQTGYIWYMTRMFGSSTLDYNFDIDLPDLFASEANTLSFRIRQENVSSTITHRITVFVNDEIVSSNQADPNVHSWAGNGMFNFSRNTSAFRPGTNRIKIRVLRTMPDNLFLDYIRVSYDKALVKGNAQYSVNGYGGVTARYNFSGSASNISVYRVADDYTVSVLPYETQGSGFSFVGQSNASTRYYLSRPEELLSPVLVQRVNPTNLAELGGAIQSVIVSPSEFFEKAQELAQMYQQNWGYSTKVVLQEDIFNQFNGGHPDPAAVRQYVRYLYHNAPAPKIQSLTLLGLGSLDWRNYSRSAANQNRIMIYQHPNTTPPNVSDDYFAMITTNTYPEIAVGRYPVSNMNELNNMLNNFRRYTQNPKPGLWRNSMVFLADDFVNGDTTTDWQHTRDMQALANTLNPAVYNEKIFAQEWDYDEFLNKPRVRDELFNQINQGKFLWYYVGHGSFDALGMQNYFTGATDMGRFQNPDMLPLFITASCEVSAFDHWAYESLGQKTVLLDNRGAIASVGATRKSFPDPNHGLMIHFLANIVNYRNPVGYSLANAKLRYTQSTINDEMYILFGDPNLRITPPERDSTMTIITGNETRNTLHSRELARLQGSFSAMGLSGEAQLMAYDPLRQYSIGHIAVSQAGTKIFDGGVSVSNSEFDGGFYVPDDIISGNTGLITAYHWDAANKKDYLSYYHPLALSDEVLPDAPANDGPPTISLYLGSYDFREGDTVSTSPTLYAKISDGNGINVTGSAGHNILLVIDNSLQPIPITEYFSYDRDSYTSGTIVYPLQNLSEGLHTVQVIAFDNFNLPAVQSTSFIARKSAAISLENLLVYPNPIKKDGYITFIISESAEITLDVYTMSGRRIRRIQTQVQPGFQTIPFDGRDDMGAKLANNTYFIRVRAKNAEGKTVEKRERMVIYK